MVKGLMDNQNNPIIMRLTDFTMFTKVDFLCYEYVFLNTWCVKYFPLTQQQKSKKVIQ